MFVLNGVAIGLLVRRPPPCKPSHLPASLSNLLTHLNCKAGGMNSVKRCCLQSARAARASRPWRPLGLGLRGIALLGYTELGVVDAEDGLSDDLDCLAGDFLLIRIFAGAQLALNQDRIALFEGAGKLGEVAPGSDAEPIRGFMRLVGLVRPLLCGGDGKARYRSAALSGHRFCVLAEVS
jgi:hypothetical protein